MRFYNNALGASTESWINPKAKKGLPSKIAGKGLFAIQPISKGEIVVVKGGRIINKATFEKYNTIIKDSELQITDDLFIAPLTKKELEPSMGYLNHSCDPNTGFGGNIIVVAMRDIAAGEELTIDYAMHQTDPVYRMECNCQSKICRNVINGEDWKNPELQKKYDGYFQWYIEQKIKNQERSVL